MRAELVLFAASCGFPFTAGCARQREVPLQETPEPPVDAVEVADPASVSDEERRPKAQEAPSSERRASTDKQPTLWRVEVGGKYGYVDATGTYVIKPRSRYSLGFSEGLAGFEAGEAEGFKRGYIDRTDTVVIEPRFQAVRQFSEGRAAVRDGHKWGYVDRTGRYVVEPRFDDAKPFSEGLACVNVGGEPDYLHGYSYSKGGKWGYVDATGKLAIEPHFDSAGDFSEGFAWVVNDSGRSKGSGFIDKKGRFVLGYLAGQTGYTSYRPFSDRLAAVQVGDDWGFIDTTGTMVVEPRFGNADAFSEGLARISLGDKRGYKSGYINKGGHVVIKPIYVEAGPFRDGLARVRIEKKGRYWGKGDSWGYINRSGKLVLDARFNEAKDFWNGLAWVHVGGELEEWAVHQPPRWKGGEWLLIDRSGRRVWPMARGMEATD